MSRLQEINNISWNCYSLQSTRRQNSNISRHIPSSLAAGPPRAMPLDCPWWRWSIVLALQNIHNNNQIQAMWNNVLIKQLNTIYARHVRELIHTWFPLFCSGLKLQIAPPTLMTLTLCCRFTLAANFKRAATFIHPQAMNSTNTYRSHRLLDFVCSPTFTSLPW